MARIWILTVGEPSPVHAPNGRRMRTGTLAGELTRRGHEVTWWKSSFDHNTKENLEAKTIARTWDGGSIVFLRSAVAYRSNVSPRRIVHNILTARQFRLAALREPRPDVILVSLPTLELAYEAVEYGRARDIPVIVDVRDLWPDIFAQAIPKFIKPLGGALLAPFVRQARRALTGARAVTGVSEGYLKWGLDYAQRSRTQYDAVFPIGYPGAAETCGAEQEPGQDDERWLAAQGIDRSKFIVWFVGTFGRSYDLMTVIEAARLLASRGESNYHFVISGEGEIREELERRARGVDSVSFTGWIDAGKIRLLQSVARAGLMAYTDTATQGFPNKIFEYMAAGIPILSSLRGEASELIQTNALGLNYDPGSAASLANCVEAAADPVSHQAMSDNCVELFLREYDMRKIYPRFATYLEGFVECGDASVATAADSHSRA